MLLKYLFIVAGGLSLIVGIVGIFLPLLPTTPFLLLSGFFFSKGSEKFHNWLVNHKYLGPPIQDWKKNGVIRLKHKLLATIMLMISAVYILPKANIPLFGKLGFLFFSLSVLIFIWTRPSLPKV
jgi:uncharacterized membrane protein YbaN (DUF454 family)